MSENPSNADQARAVGLPAAAAVFAETAFTAPTGTTYRIITTIERDDNDTPTMVFAADARPAAASRSAGDRYKGTARRAAKLGIASAPIEVFGDVTALIATVPTHATMKNRQPPIGATATSNRVDVERRNVRLRGFLYAASREDDNDFHLIVGRDRAATPPTYLTVEIAGLPSGSAGSFATLKAARAAFKSFFGSNLPGYTYDFYNPPIPVEIEGSLFWDASHATGSRPGPSSLRPHMPVVWEIHPITKITFEPS